MCQYCTAHNFDGGNYDELDEFLVIRQNFTIQIFLSVAFKADTFHQNFTDIY